MMTVSASTSIRCVKHRAGLPIVPRLSIWRSGVEFVKQDFRENREANTKRVEPLAIELRAKRKLMERLLHEQCGAKYLLSSTKKTLKAVRYYVALSETGWKRPSPYIIKKHLTRFRDDRLIKVLADGEANKILAFICNVHSGHEKLIDVARVEIASELDEIALAVKQQRLKQALAAARSLPLVITRVVDALPVKRAGSKRVNLPRAVLIQELNRIWHGLRSHDEWPLDVDETEKDINGTFSLPAPKVVFFQTCFALASEELPAHEINRHWRVYRRKHLPAK
jgi:hypothetical protein